MTRVVGGENQPAAVARSGLALVAVLSLGGLTIWSTAGFAVAPLVPQAGRILAPGNADAMAAMVRSDMNAARSVAALPPIHQLAQLTLARNPLDHATATNIGMMDIVSGRTAEGNQIMRLVGRATLREALAHSWLLNLEFRAQNRAATVREADIVMRLSPDLRRAGYAMLNALVEDGRVIPQLSGLLVQRPPWRSGFLSDMGQNGTSTDNERRLLLSLRRSAAPPTAEELRTWFNRRAETATATALMSDFRLLSPAQFPATERFIRNGNFERAPMFGPYEWTVYTTDRGAGEIGPSPDGQGKALYAEFQGQQPAAAAAQLLTIAPGNFSMTARIYALSDLTNRQSHVQISCRSGRTETSAATLDISGARDSWATRRWTFTLPANCAAPVINLVWRPTAANAPEQFYIDDIVIQRLAAQPVRQTVRPRSVEDQLTEPDRQPERPPAPSSN